MPGLGVQLPGGVQLPEIAGTQIVTFVLVLGRVGPLFLLAPVLSSPLVSVRARLGVAACISLALTPIAEHGRALPGDTTGLVLWLVAEIGVGIAFALALGVVTAAVEAGGSLLDAIVGFSFGAIVDPITGIQASVLGKVYSLVAAMVLVLGGGVQLMVLGLARSYALVPLGEFPAVSNLGRLAGQALVQVPVIALELVGPVVVALIFTDAALGLVSRAVPQMNVFVVGLPLKVLISFAVVATSLPFVGTHLLDDLQSSILQSLHALAGH